MAEQRSLKRRHLIYYLKIVDRDTDNLVGFLVDITTRGIMVMSEEPIEIGKVFHMKMLLQTDLSNKQFLHFDAKSKWTDKSINTDFYDTGFELIDIDSDDFKEFDRVIEALGFND